MSEKVYMKGYKAFGAGMVCAPSKDKPFKYEVGGVYEEPEADLCSKGFHFCKKPLDVLNYYPLVDKDGNMSEFAEVEALEEPIDNGSDKVVTRKIKIGAKLSFADLVNASLEFEHIKESKEKTTDKDCARIGSSGNYAQIGSSGDYAQIGSSGDYARIGSSGDDARIGSSGYYAQIGSSGNCARIGSSGYGARIGSSGNYAQIGSSGDYARIGSSGNYAQIGSSGYYAQIGSSGDYARIGSSGDYARIGSSGYGAQIGSSGNGARIGSSGNDVQINSTGEDSVICCAGNNCVVKAKKGSWITLSEWKYDEEKERSIPVCVKTEYVDGEHIKEDTYYKLVGGEFVEAANV